jgi:GTP-binding protein
MNIKKAIFLKSATDYRECPKPDKPEYAFIGRSNVGKSSLINMLTGNSSLAKTSSRPGKTQLINHFLINDHWYLVDLPGYGFAKVSRVEREKWDKMIKDYLKSRENLMGVFVLIDSRIDPQKQDLDFLEWLGILGIPFVIAFTKSDKQTKNKTLSLISQYKKEMSRNWEEFPHYFITSAEKGIGKEEILKFIEGVNVSFRKEK